VYAVAADRRTFGNTIAALQYAEESLSDVQQQLDLMVSVHPDDAVRESAQRMTDHIDEENVKMDYDHRLWNAVSEWATHREPLAPAEQKLADDTIRDLKRMGFSLPEDQFAALKTNVTELKKLQTEFEKAINDWEDHVVVTREQLAGLPERYIEGLTREGDAYRVSLDYPEYFPFMRQADDAASRERLATKD
jgi:thimet oligopeptidase